DPAGHQVTQLNAVERLALARLDELVLDDRAGIAIEHHLQTALEFVGRIARHDSSLNDRRPALAVAQEMNRRAPTRLSVIGVPHDNPKPGRCAERPPCLSPGACSLAGSAGRRRPRPARAVSPPGAGRALAARR